MAAEIIEALVDTAESTSRPPMFFRGPTAMQLLPSDSIQESAAENERRVWAGTHAVWVQLGPRALAAAMRTSKAWHTGIRSVAGYSLVKAAEAWAKYDSPSKR